MYNNKNNIIFMYFYLKTFLLYDEKMEKNTNAIE